jgi:putative lipoic acid-binding regulatory protein
MIANQCLLRFPCAFPIKIMGRNEPRLREQVIEVICAHAPDFDPAMLQARNSRHANYVGLTATIEAQSRDQLDAIYRALCAHPLVEMVL